MGTYILRPVSVSSPNTGWETLIAGVPNFSPSNAELVEAANSDADPMSFTGLRITGIGSGTVGFSCVGLGLYLDGSLVPIDTNNLPLGFTVVSAHFIAQSAFNVPGVGKQIIYSRDGFTIHTSTVTEDVDVDLGVLTNIALVGSILAVSGDTPDGTNIASNGISIAGVYTTSQFTFTLNPSSGDVESGQGIEVESPDIDVQTLEYAAVNGNSIIPLIPKKNPDGTVTLIVPKPASDDCLDALTDCPECEDCFNTCNEDLESEACQACMEACLNCLTSFFENLELAEECNDSTHEGPGEVQITIIVSGPGLTGAVALGIFTILETNGSGIYQFQPGKTNDTLYSSTRDGTTYDAKIPNPFFKTGFFRS